MVFMSALLSFKSLTLQMNALDPATAKRALSCRVSTQNAPSAPAAAHLAAAVNHGGFCKSLIPT